MRYFAFQLALLIGVEPFTFMVMGLLAGLCAFWMKEMMPNPWMAVLFYPLLLAGGVAMVAIATAVDLVEPIEVRFDGEGNFDADWKQVTETLPLIVLAGIAGMCVAAVGIIHAVKALSRYV